MKRAYGQYQFSKHLSRLERFDVFQARENFHRAFPDWDTGHIDAEVAALANCWLAESNARDGNCHHFFFTGDGMLDWLRGCRTVFGEESVRVLNDFAVEYHGKSASEAPFIFMLHFVGGTSPVSK